MRKTVILGIIINTIMGILLINQGIYLINIHLAKGILSIIVGLMAFISVGYAIFKSNQSE